jgi:MFS family permease
MTWVMTAGVPDELERDAIDAYLAEYAQCANTYTSTYATIWSAGALFTATSAAFLVVAGLQSGPIRAAVLFAPLPIIFWYLGLFRPMNRYAELRTKRLERIEHLLNRGVPGLHMEHFHEFNQVRRGFRGLDEFFHPRVHTVVGLFFWLVVGVEVYLLWTFQQPDGKYLFPDYLHWLLIVAVLILGLHVVGDEIRSLFTTALR